MYSSRAIARELVALASARAVMIDIDIMIIERLRYQRPLHGTHALRHTRRGGRLSMLRRQRW